MQRLQRMVADALEKELSCEVPDEEIRRVWPNEVDRHHRVARFY